MKKKVEKILKLAQKFKVNVKFIFQSFDFDFDWIKKKKGRKKKNESNKKETKGKVPKSAYLTRKR